MAASFLVKASTALGGGGSFKHKPSSLPSTSPHQIQLIKVNSRVLKKLTSALRFHVEAPSAKEEPVSILRRDEWRELLAALAREEQVNLLDLMPRRMDPLELGGVIMEDAIIKQSFPIRSYEVGADERASIETLLRHLQETSLSQVRALGLLADGFGATSEMSKRDLIWVFTKMQVVVEKYPTWGDVVEVESWVNAQGKNGLSRDWHIRDCATGQTIARAMGLLVMMNKSSRKLSKIPEEVRREIQGAYVDREHVIVQENGETRIPKLDVNSAHFVRENLRPQWSDLDANQHVNNVKYISWILESVPEAVVEKYDLAGMTLEYRRECHRDSVLRSFTSIVDGDIGNSGFNSSGVVDCNHLLLLQDGAEILRGHTQWKPKKTKKLASLPLSP